VGGEKDLKMKLSPLKRFGLITLALGFLACPILQAAPTDSPSTPSGNIHIFIKDASGQYLPDAPVTLFDGHKMYTAKSSFLGAVSLELPAGRYAVSSAMMVPMKDFNQRIASPEAHIMVIPDDTSTVILTLNPVAEPNEELTQATLEKMGIADQVAKYTN
jgi:hypothetical protein